jgi:hypothetical protein
MLHGFPPRTPQGGIACLCFGFAVCLILSAVSSDWTSLHGWVGDAIEVPAWIANRERLHLAPPVGDKR